WGLSQRPAVLSEAPRAAVLLRCLRRRLVVAVGLGVVLAAAAGAGGRVFPPPPPSQGRTLLRGPARAPYFVRTSEAVPDLGSHQRNQIAMGKSRLVLRAALRDPEAAGLRLLDSKLDPLGWLEKQVQIDFSVAPEIMRIVLRGTSAEEP